MTLQRTNIVSTVSRYVAYVSGDRVAHSLSTVTQLIRRDNAGPSKLKRYEWINVWLVETIEGGEYVLHITISDRGYHLLAISRRACRILNDLDVESRLLAHQRCTAPFASVLLIVMLA